MILNQDNTLMIIIDIQEKLVNVAFNKNSLEQKAIKLVSAMKTLNIPTIITEQYPKGLGETIKSIKDTGIEALFFEKTDFNALKDKILLQKLKEINKKQIILFGIETHICVHQTAAALVNLGYDVTIAKDACGSRAESEYLSALDYMKTYGCKIKTTEMIIFELLKTAKHPNFKEIQTLIK
ncbi:MAG: isochorismatase family protein [Cyanobacteria bacterium SIG31]|nr:isochorismatase family protein [Cyanobacteria bacterium SIG31]